MRNRISFGLHRDFCTAKIGSLFEVLTNLETEFRLFDVARSLKFQAIHHHYIFAAHVADL